MWRYKDITQYMSARCNMRLVFLILLRFDTVTTHAEGIVIGAINSIKAGQGLNHIYSCLCIQFDCTWW